MRISDWSSDVCSSELPCRIESARHLAGGDPCRLIAPRLERDQLVMRIGPGDARHIGVRRRSQFDRIAAPVGIDDEIGDQPRNGWLYQNMIAVSGPGAARSEEHTSDMQSTMSNPYDVIQLE